MGEWLCMFIDTPRLYHSLCIHTNLPYREASLKPSTRKSKPTKSTLPSSSSSSKMVSKKGLESIILPRGKGKYRIEGGDSGSKKRLYLSKDDDSRSSTRSPSSSLSVPPPHPPSGSTSILMMKMIDDLSSGSTVAKLREELKESRRSYNESNEFIRNIGSYLPSRYWKNDDANKEGGACCK